MVGKPWALGLPLLNALLLGSSEQDKLSKSCVRLLRQVEVGQAAETGLLRVAPLCLALLQRGYTEGGPDPGWWGEDEKENGRGGLKPSSVSG